MHYAHRDPLRFCNHHSACLEGTSFAVKYPTMHAVWEACYRADWLLWILTRLKRRTLDGDAGLRGFAHWCARNTPLPGGDPISSLLGEADLKRLERISLTREEYDAQKELDRGKCYDLWVQGKAAELAAFSAARTALHPDPAYAARYAAEETLSAVRALAATERPAVKSAQLAQANQLRLLIPNPFQA